MATYGGGQNAGDRSVIENLAARLMGRRTNAIQTATPAAQSSVSSTPRTMPNVQSSSPAPPASSSAATAGASSSAYRPAPTAGRNENAPPSSHYSSSPAQPAFTTSAATSRTASTVHERDNNYPATISAAVEARREKQLAGATTNSSTAVPPTPAFPGYASDACNAGPSLRGTPEQIAEAHAFSKSTGSSGGKRGEHAERRRVLSTAPSFSSSTSSRTAASLASSGYPPMSSTPRLRPAAPVNTAAPAAPINSAWNSFAANPATTAEEKIAAREGRPFAPMESSKGKAPFTSNEKQNEAKTDGAKPSLRVTVPSQNHTPAPQPTAVPPHLRSKAVEIKPATGTSNNPIVIEDAPKQPSAKPQDLPPVTPINPIVPEFGGPKVDEIKKEPVDTPEIVTSMRSAGSSAVKLKSEPKPEPQMVNGITHKSDEATASDSDVLATLKDLKAELVAVCRRIATLEEDSFTTQKQMEHVIQSEERRKYLGTDSAKMPFGVEVNYGNVESAIIQVNIELKISELIRRIRTKLNLSPTQTMKPRISIAGEQAGHDMTLGELGVTKDRKTVVKFDYER